MSYNTGLAAGLSEFPNPNIPEKDKDENYHRQYVQAITVRNVDSSYDIGYYTMNESYNFYQGLQSSDDFSFLQTAEDGDVLPAQWLNYNKIGTKIDLMLGELSSKSFDIKVTSTNRDAKIRKFRAKEDSRVEMRMQPMKMQLEQDHGMALGGDDKFVASNTQELDEYYDYTYKEKGEIIMHYMLKDFLKRSHWEYQRIALFRDLLIAGVCVVKNEIVNGIPTTLRIDPRNFIFDRAMQDDHGRSSTFYGEIMYLSFSELAQQYGLTKKELNAVYDSYQDYRTRGIGTLNEDGQSGIAEFEQFQNSKEVAPFKKMDGELRAVVVKAVWRDYRNISYKNSKDKHGNAHFKKMAEPTVKRAKNGEIEEVNIEIWRQGTLIAGEIMKDYGEIKNQARDVDNLATTTPPYKMLIPHFVNGVSVSKVESLKGLQNLKDIIMFNVQLAMARAGAKGFVYDVAQVPDEWDIHNVIKYLKTTGIAFIDSAKDGIPAQYNQFNPIDMTLSSAVSQYIELSMHVDAEMSSISGINEARQGEAQPYQKTGVNQSSLLQSNLTTETYYRFFSEFSDEVFTQLAGLGKIAWADNKKFAYIIGDAGIDFLKNDIDLDLDDYGVIIEDIPEALNDSARFQEIVQAALQSGQIDFISAIKLMRESDITQGIIRLERDIEKKQKAAMEMQQQQQQAEAQQAMQMQQQAQQADAQKQQQDMQAKIMELEAKLKGEKELKQMEGNSKYATEKLKTGARTKQDVMRHKTGLAEKKMDIYSNETKQKE